MGELDANWISKGYDYKDQKLDSDWHKLAMFCLVTMSVVLCTVWAYQPDRRMKDWAIREAYLVLREREAAGVEPLSKDLVDPNLTSDSGPSSRRRGVEGCWCGASHLGVRSHTN